jgi:C-terminal processing protease CtpA/Prc
MTIRGMKSVMLLCVVGTLLVSGCESFRLAAIPLERFGSVWMVTEMKEGQLIVLLTEKDSPAFRSGIQSGDIIIEINDKATRNMTLADTTLKIAGEAGTTVKLKTLRPSTGEVKEHSIIRESVAIAQVRGSASQHGQDSPAVLPTTLPPPVEPATPF